MACLFRSWTYRQVRARQGQHLARCANPYSCPAFATHEHTETDMSLGLPGTPCFFNLNLTVTASRAGGCIDRGGGAAEAPTLNTQHSHSTLTLNTQHSHSTLNTHTQHSTLNTQHSTLSTQHSTLNTQHSAQAFFSTFIVVVGIMCMNVVIAVFLQVLAYPHGARPVHLTITMI